MVMRITKHTTVQRDMNGLWFITIERGGHELSEEKKEIENGGKNVT
jgi:hypothetical protein